MQVYAEKRFYIISFAFCTVSFSALQHGIIHKCCSKYLCARVKIRSMWLMNSFYCGTSTLIQWNSAPNIYFGIRHWKNVQVYLISTQLIQKFKTMLYLVKLFLYFQNGQDYFFSKFPSLLSQINVFMISHLIPPQAKLGFDIALGLPLIFRVEKWSIHSQHFFIVSCLCIPSPIILHQRLWQRGLGS